MPENNDAEVLKARGRDALRLSDKYMVARLPEPLRSASRAGLGRFEEWFLEARPPALVVLGQPGAGMTTLINALFAEPVGGVGAGKKVVRAGKWNTYATECGALLVLDARDIPTADDAESESDFATEKIHTSLDEQCPDAFLLVVTAHVSQEELAPQLKALRELRSYAKRKCGSEPHVVGVLTHLDELAPAGADWMTDEKQAAIARAKNELLDQIEQALDEEIKLFPVSALADYGKDGAVESDRRWNIDRLAEHLFEVLPASAQVQFVRITRLRPAQRKLSRDIIRGAAAAAGGVAATPIPIADMPLITSIQLMMITAIGYVSGRQMSKRVATEFISAMGLNVGAGFAFREVSRALVKYVFPGAGNFISAAVSAGATWALGEAAVAYFVDARGVDEARNVYSRLRSASGSVGSRILAGGRAAGTRLAAGGSRVGSSVAQRLGRGRSKPAELPEHLETEPDS